MARRGATCPPGVWCFTPTLGFLILGAILVAAFFIFSAKQYNQPTMNRTPPIHIQNSPPSVTSSDDRQTRAPEPLRFWQTGPDLRGGLLPPGAVPINVPTRGLPQAFQQVGILKTDGQILPLYGRQTAYRTDRYNYQTRTDTQNPVQLPVRQERKDCMDSIGCNELLGGERVKVSGTNQEANVEVQKFDGPTYIPGII